MSNNLLAFSPEYWSKRIQALLKKSLISREIANFEEQPTLVNGYKVHRPKMSDVGVNDYVKGTDVTVQDMTATDEYLTVDQSKEISFYFDNIDKIQNKYDTANYYIDRAAYQLRNEIDAKFLAEVSNASLTFDDGDLGGTAGNPVTLTKTNVIDLFSGAKAKMRQAFIEDDKPWDAVVSPDVVARLTQAQIFTGFQVADETIKNGYKGDFMGFKVYESQNINHSTVLSYTNGSNFTDTKTFTLKVGPTSVVFTFVASLGTTAGNVLIGASADATAANLAAAINGSAGAGSTYVDISTENRNALKNSKVVATASSSGDTVTLSTAGRPFLSTTETTLVIGSSVANNLFAREGVIDMVMQADIETQMNKEPRKTGYTFINWCLYGIKTFTEGANRMMKVQTK